MYLVKSDILACFGADDRRGLQYIPAGDLLETAVSSADAKMTEVLWAGKCLWVFQATLDARADVLLSIAGTFKSVTSEKNEGVLPEGTVDRLTAVKDRKAFAATVATP
jgi:hypothetical protein